MMRLKIHIMLGVCLPVLTAYAQAPTALNNGFEKSVLPVITSTCAPCHNDRMASGGLNLGLFGTKTSMIDQREGWELIIQKVRSGEMPPQGVPRPAEKLDAMMKFLHEEFARAFSWSPLNSQPVEMECDFPP